MGGGGGVQGGGELQGGKGFRLVVNEELKLL